MAGPPGLVRVKRRVFGSKGFIMPLGRTAEKLRRKGLLRQTDKMRVSGEVFFSDTTLRDGEQMPGVSFSPSVKAQIARDLEAVGVHSIEAGFAAAGEIEVRAISAVSAAVSKPIVVSLARARASDIDLAAEALCSRPRHKRGVAVFLATSSAHREHKLGMSRLEVLRSIERALHRASDHFDIIAFGAEDASRTEPDFLADCLRVAIDAGATSVGVPDTLGLLTPKTAADFLRRLQDDVPNIEGALRLRTVLQQLKRAYTSCSVPSAGSANGLATPRWKRSL